MSDRPADYPDTPELDKRGMQIKALHTQAIGIFVEWLNSQGMWIAHYAQFDDIKDPMLVTVDKSIEQLLADFAGIDLNKVEQERRVLLEYVQARQSR
jgi:hypothetical protein